VCVAGYRFPVAGLSRRIGLLTGATAISLGENKYGIFEQTDLITSSDYYRIENIKATQFSADSIRVQIIPNELETVDKQGWAYDRLKAANEEILIDLRKK
jgi:hypothetical protein